jgi:hypothetical protein
MDARIALLARTALGLPERKQYTSALKLSGLRLLNARSQMPCWQWKRLIATRLLLWSDAELWVGCPKACDIG